MNRRLLLAMAIIILTFSAERSYAGSSARARALFDRGRACESTGAYEQAVRWYTEALKLKPETATYYYFRGRAYRLLARPNVSVKDLSTAISLKPGYHDAYNERGMAYVVLGRRGEAESDFRKACGHGFADGCLNLKRLLEEK